MQIALRQFVAEEDSDYFVTANFNRNTNIEAARKALKRWSAMIDRRLVGKHWSKKNADERMFYFAAAEHIHSNLHWHMLVRLPNEKMKQSFNWIASNYWKQIVKSGDMNVQLIDNSKDKIKATNYTAKDLWRTENYNTFTISTEFSGL